MKYIVKGKTYNTKTARELGATWNGETGLNYYRETLYRKKTGEYFLHIEGGAMTSCARPCGHNSWTGSSKVMVMSEAHAKEWVERYLEAEEYIAIWGEPKE